jgi:hypothetical protein
MALGSRSPWGVLGKAKNSFRHSPGESKSLGGTWERTKIASVMALWSRSPWGVLGKDKNSFRHGPEESESLGSTWAGHK